MNWILSKLMFNAYEVSEDGEIRHANTKHIWKQSVNPRNGRLYIVFSYEGKQYSKIVARVVAEAFVPNPNNYSDVNHINGIKTDNRAVNLEWVTRRMNILHDYKIGKRKKGKDLKTGIRYKGCKTSKPVVQCDLQGNIVGLFTGFMDAQNMTGVRYRNIEDNCRGRRKTAGGFVWKFKEDGV